MVVPSAMYLVKTMHTYLPLSVLKPSTDRVVPLTFPTVALVTCKICCCLEVVPECCLLLAFILIWTFWCRVPRLFSVDTCLFVLEYHVVLFLLAGVIVTGHRLSTYQQKVTLIFLILKNTFHHHLVSMLALVESLRLHSALTVNPQKNGERKLYFMSVTCFI